MNGPAKTANIANVSKSFSFDLVPNQQISRANRPVRSLTAAFRTSSSLAGTESRPVSRLHSGHYSATQEKTKDSHEVRLSKRKSFINTLFHRTAEASSAP